MLSPLAGTEFLPFDVHDGVEGKIDYSRTSAVNRSVLWVSTRPLHCFWDVISFRFSTLSDWRFLQARSQLRKTFELNLCSGQLCDDGHEWIGLRGWRPFPGALFTLTCTIMWHSCYSFGCLKQFILLTRLVRVHQFSSRINHYGSEWVSFNEEDCCVFSWVIRTTCNRR